MEGILQSKEKSEVTDNLKEIDLCKKIDELLKNTFDYNSNIVFFPIRHHSPVCSYHLKKVIAEYEPEIILIEGPEDANDIKKFLCDENSIMPLAVYYSYNDTKGYINEEKSQYKCYYPFLNASPELVALREGRKFNIETKFIDLPYYEILINSKEGRGLLKNDDKNTYNDDYLIAENKYIHTLCEKQNCRNFSELWEKLFEIKGLYLDTEEFVKNMLLNCYISRLYSSNELLKSEGCLARETFMAQNIQKESNEHKKILVVTGGFHTYGIYNLMEKENKFKLHKINRSDCGVYLMPYSMESADALNGYASGMIYPNFYNDVWENIENNSEKPYEEAVLKNFIKTGKIVRKNDGCLSTFDEICAFNMAKGLADLRDKEECGIYELIDGVMSSYIKGDLNVSTEEPLNVLAKNMRGDFIGTLCENADVPPIIEDFKKISDKYKINLNTTLEQIIVLEMYSKERHRKISFFLHRMNFLNTGFCSLKKGPDVIHKKNLNLIRETWNYKFSTNVNSKLIDNSVYGATLEECARTVVKKKIKESAKNSGDIAELLVQSLKMGLYEVLNGSIENLNNIIADDGSFVSLMECLYYLNYIYEINDLYKVDSAAVEEIKNIIRCTYNKLCILIPHLFNTKTDETLKTINALKKIYNIVLKRELKFDEEIFKEAVKSLISHNDVNSGIEGACLGILYALDEIDISAIKKKVEGYLLGTKDVIQSIPEFLSGLFCTCRDLIFIDNCILECINKFVNTITAEIFMEVIPQFRLAFSYFTPREIDLIGEKIACIYGISKEKFKDIKAVNPETVNLGLKLNEYAVNLLKNENIL